MGPEPTKRVSDIYHAALDEPPDERSAFLDRACGHDEALRREVESLLRFDSAAPAFLERPPALIAGTETIGKPAMVDRQLGRYTIVAPLGAGGMGEVYRARDSKLGRDVAIKILPAHCIGDPERRARFAREARVLATLNHPHIGAIYGLEEADGVTAIVLELVEGPTLAERLRRGPLEIREAVTVAAQIADALDAAHQRGIVHRDLKPANIALQGSWSAGDLRAKALDFGLAKTMHAEGVDHQTLSLELSGDGRILGTAPDMSPEQSRGQPLDKRTDIWAFGCLLFEMLSGTTAFNGATVTDTLARIIEREPDWGALPPETPETIVKLLRRTLAKDPARRLRDIGDARPELDDALSPALAGSLRSGVAAQRPIWKPLAIASGLIAVAALGWAGWSGSRAQPEGAARTPGPMPADTRLQVTRLTFDDGLQTNPALSPDGRFVAYASNNAGNLDIYTQPIAGGNPVAVTTHPAHDWQPDWSVNDQIVFRSERDGGGLYVVAQTGGFERRVSSFGNVPRWSPDGTRILFRRWPTTEIFIVGTDGAVLRPCQPCAGGALAWFKDHRHLTRLSTTAPPSFEPELKTIDVESGETESWSFEPAVVAAFTEARVFAVVREPAVWSPDWKTLYFIGQSRRIESLWKLDVDPEKRVVTGGPHRLTAMAEANEGLTIARATGRIAFGAASRVPRLALYPLDATGHRITGPAQTPTSSATESNYADITPDGARLVFNVHRPGGLDGWELRTRALSERTDRVLRVSDDTRGEARTQPHISPKGNLVVYRYIPPESIGQGRGGGTSGPQLLRLLDVESDRESDLTPLADGLIVPNGWSADGRYVIATLQHRRLSPTEKGMAIALIPIEPAPNGERRLQIVTRANGNIWQPSVSPNNRWIAFRVGADPRQIAIVHSPDGLWNETQDESRWRFLDEHDTAVKDKAVWSTDGRILYYVSASGGLLNLWGVDFDPGTGKVGKPFQLTSFNGPGEHLPQDLTFFETATARRRLVVSTLRPVGWIAMLATH